MDITRNWNFNYSCTVRTSLSCHVERPMHKKSQKSGWQSLYLFPSYMRLLIVLQKWPSLLAVIGKKGVNVATLVNRFQSIYNNAFEDLHSHYVNTYFPIIASNETLNERIKVCGYFEKFNNILDTYHFNRVFLSFVFREVPCNYIWTCSDLFT